MWSELEFCSNDQCLWSIQPVVSTASSFRRLTRGSTKPARNSPELVATSICRCFSLSFLDQVPHVSANRNLFTTVLDMFRHIKRSINEKTSLDQIYSWPRLVVYTTEETFTKVNEWYKWVQMGELAIWTILFSNHQHSQPPNTVTSICTHCWLIFQRNAPTKTEFHYETQHKRCVEQSLPPIVKTDWCSFTSWKGTLNTWSPTRHVSTSPEQHCLHLLTWSHGSIPQHTG